MRAIFAAAVRAPVCVGTSTKWSSNRGRRYWLWWAVDGEGEVLDFLVQPRRCAKSARRLLRNLLKKQGYAPTRITTDKLKSYAVAVRNGCLLSTSRDYERTIERRTRTSRCDDANENNSGSNRRDRPSGFCQSMRPSTTPSTFNAIFYPAASSRCFVPRRLLSGIKVGLPPDPDQDRILATAVVNVSMPWGVAMKNGREKLGLVCRWRKVASAAAA